MNEESVRETLRALADADAGAEARPEIELNLRQAFRARRRKRVGREAMIWAAAVAAIVVMMVSMNRKPLVVSPVGPQPSEVVTDFFPLMDPAPPFQRGRILRIEVPASAMKMVGLPVHEQHLNDPVQADVLVGEEGLPRAIRFVKLEREAQAR